jgi:hypothetical protein
MRKRPRPDQIAAILRDFQADLDAGLNIDQACRKAGIGPTTDYRWKALHAPIRTCPAFLFLSRFPVSACGRNSAKTTFAQAVETVRASVASLDAIKAAVKAGANDDVATDTARHILENGLVKLVASFQRYAEAAFHSLPNAGSFTVRRNLFQNLDESSALWRSATGKGYDDFLDASDLSALKIFWLM